MTCYISCRPSQKWLFQMWEWLREKHKPAHDDGNADEEDDKTRITSFPFILPWFRVVSQPLCPALEGAEIKGVRSGC